MPVGREAKVASILVSSPCTSHLTQTELIHLQVVLLVVSPTEQLATDGGVPMTEDTFKDYDKRKKDVVMTA